MTAVPTFYLDTVVQDLTVPHSPEQWPCPPDLAHVRMDASSIISAIAAPGQTHSAKLTASGTAEGLVSTMLDTLSGLLLVPQYTRGLMQRLRPILVDLVARWCLSTAHTAVFSQLPAWPTGYRLDDMVILAFAALLPTCPQIKPFMWMFFSNRPCALTPLTAADRSVEVVRTVLSQAVRLLVADCTDMIPTWDWTTLHQLLLHPDAAIRHFASLGLATYLRLSEQDRHQLRDRYLSPDEQVPFLLTTWHDQLLIDQEQTDAIAGTFTSHSGPTTFQFPVACGSVCPLVVDLCGVLLPRALGNHVLQAKLPQHTLVLTPTTRGNLRAMALAVSQRFPVLLQGETGVGKTSLVEDMAQMLGQKLVKIHLGDQADSKTLLGTYVTTSTPGHFRWQPGILTTAVQSGWWVLFEDIDMAPLDVVSALVSLLEERTLFIPNRGERLKAHHQFQLLATRGLTILADGRAVPRVTSNDHMLGSLWTRLTVQAPSLTELTQVVAHTFPTLQQLAPHLVELYGNIAALVHSPSFTLSAVTKGRLLSPRDLLKWCRRLADYFACGHGNSTRIVSTVLSDQAQTVAFQEAMDCFGEMLCQPDSYSQLAITVGNALGMTSDQVKLFADTYRPELHVVDRSLQVGRAQLARLPAKAMVPSSTRFAYTCQSLRLMERLTRAVGLAEPVLLVGETGAGKTTVVQHLATLLNQQLHVVNLSQQSDSSDLLGGFKPVDARVVVRPLKEQFEQLFEQTFSLKKNAGYLEKMRTFYGKKQWKKLVLLFTGAVKMADQRFARLVHGTPSANEMHLDPPTSSVVDHGNDSGQNLASQAKRVKRSLDPNLVQAWRNFDQAVQNLQAQLHQMERQLLFSFVEGTLVTALQQGHWILLDEMNLASSDTLESLSDLLQSIQGSVLLTERGDQTPVRRHPNFRVFACMNPATDVGKRDLPPGLRNRFSEYYAHPPDSRMDDLLMLIQKYLHPCAPKEPRLAHQVADFYLAAKGLAQRHQLVDGGQQRPHYSVRTLTRALQFAAQAVHLYPVRRAMYDGLCMTFVTQLHGDSQRRLMEAIYEHIVPADQAEQMVPKLTAHPGLTDSHLAVGHCWVPRGPLPADSAATARYVLTLSVQANLANLARVVMCGRYPVLIQGPTSSGKTSMVEYLAHLSGHKFVRINNHEHTDIQEYLGTYVSQQGKLVFQEGILVQALRHGYWIVLDELNLAPSDVLEALNRLLDDNRELRIPETQEVVRPHPQFMLFATQNPAGLYGGRKMLSRAFRNRFVELHFDDIPESELETILSQRCQIAPSYGKRMVQVYRRLTEQRQSTRLFETKHGFITLRDMFRWANRQAIGYQELAEHGYMILAERVRQPAEKQLVKRVLEEVMRVKLNESALYQVEALPEYQAYQQLVGKQQVPEIAWTQAMRRLFVLVAQCLRHREPVLLVGDTGSGKTTVCQVLATIQQHQLHIVNCHQNTETADILGGQRPSRHRASVAADLRTRLQAFLVDAANYAPPNVQTADLETLISLFHRHLAAAITTTDASTPAVNSETMAIEQLIQRYETLFEWHDGPLVQALKTGHHFLLDEISLADDSVLERLNSVLEPHCLLVLAEKGAADMEVLHGHDDFRFLATMNPGGDYGKRELSPALRNRFTEIWVPAVTDPSDLALIIQERFRHAPLHSYGSAILSFTQWFSLHLPNSGKHSFSLRDYLSWVDFMNHTYPQLNEAQAFVHGGCLAIVDGLGSQGSPGTFHGTDQLRQFRRACVAQLQQVVVTVQPTDASLLSPELTVQDLVPAAQGLALGPFALSVGPHPIPSSQQFSFQAPTTFANLTRLVRGLQIRKPLLLEGSPGVGKTSLVASLAQAAGHRLVRINLSEQTDLMDLFGSDLPVEGGNSGEFAWCDAAFLKAMKDGSWVLLDEINLASQSVLEGLNSCLDHRGVVYIPELDREFPCEVGFRIFAAQNPLNQGGGRKGLPQSFVNRFTQIYVDQLTTDDFTKILSHVHPKAPLTRLQAMLAFNDQMHQETMVLRQLGQRGYPWEFNVRDVFRWLELVTAAQDQGLPGLPEDFLSMLYVQRFRTQADRARVMELFPTYFPAIASTEANRRPAWSITPTSVQVGVARLTRETGAVQDSVSAWSHALRLLRGLLPALEATMVCVQQGWMPILVGSAATGKTSLVRLLAQLTGHTLLEFSMNSSIDSMELLGGFEQVDLVRHRSVFVRALQQFLHGLAEQLIVKGCSADSQALTLVHATAAFSHSDSALDAVVIDHILTKAAQLALAADTMDPQAMQVQLEHLGEQWTRLQRLERQGVRGKFEWIDGVLITALEQGHWLLIDNANLCNPSVLDRLNSLLEPNGSLAIHERGLVGGDIKVVTPHPKFRLFMTCNPQFGELSRAMRNRGLEVALLDGDCQRDLYDVLQLTASYGVRHQSPPSQWLLASQRATMPAIAPALMPCSAVDPATNGDVRNKDDPGEAKGTINARDMVHEARWFAEQWQRGLIAAHPKLPESPKHWNDLRAFYTFAARHGSISGSQTSVLLAQAMYLMYLMSQSPEQWEADALSSTQPSIAAVPTGEPLPYEQLVVAAADTFFAYRSATDTRQRGTILHALYASAQSSNLTSSVDALALWIEVWDGLLTKPILFAIQATWAALVHQLPALAACTNVSQPLHVDLNSSALRVLVSALRDPAIPKDTECLYQGYRSLLTLWHTVLRHHYAVAKYTTHERQGQSLNPSLMSAAQLSDGQLRGRLGATAKRLPPWVIALKPHIVTLDAAFVEIVHTLCRGALADTDKEGMTNAEAGQWFGRCASSSAALSAWQTASARLRDCAITENADLSTIVTISRALCVSLDTLGKHPWVATLTSWTQAVVSTKGWHQVIGLGTSEMARYLWQRWHPSQLITQALRDFKARLQKVWTIVLASQPFHDFLANPLVQSKDLLQAKRDLLHIATTLFALEARTQNADYQLLTTMDGTLARIETDYATQAASAVATVDGNPLSVPAALGAQDVISMIDFTNVLQEQAVGAAIQRLVLITTWPSVEQTMLIRQIREFVNHCLQYTDRSPLTLVAYQRMLWLLEADVPLAELVAGLNPILTELGDVAGARLWHNRIQAQQSGDGTELGPLQGPALLFQGIATHGAFHLLTSFATTAVYEAEHRIEQVVFQRNQLLPYCEQISDPLTQEVTRLLMLHWQLLSLFAFEEPAQPDCAYRANQAVIAQCLAALVNPRMAFDDSKALTAVVSERLFAECAGQVVLGACRDWLQQSLVMAVDAACMQVVASPGASCQVVGRLSRAYVSLGLGLLHLLVPETAVDPAMAHFLHWQWLHDDRTRTESQLVAFTAVERVLTGQNANAVVDALMAEWQARQTSLQAFNANVVRRQDPLAFGHLYRDLRHLVDKLVAPAQLDAWLARLLDSTATTLEDHRKVAFLHDNLDHYIKRLWARYEGYGDLIHPISLFIGHIRRGLHYADQLPHLPSLANVSPSGPSHDAREVQRLIRTLLQFPFGSQLGPAATPGSVNTLLASLQRALFGTAGTVPNFNFYGQILFNILSYVQTHGQLVGIDTTAVHDTLFAHFHQLWLSMRQRQQALEQERNSLYRFKTAEHKAEDLDTANEREYRALFPSYEADHPDLELAHSAVSGAMEVDEAIDSATEAKLNFNPALVVSIAQSHRCLFASSPPPPSTLATHYILDDSWTMVQRAYTIASHLADHASSFDIAADRTLTPAHLAMLSVMPVSSRSDAPQLTSYASCLTVRDPDAGYDFYIDANVTEVRAAAPLLAAWYVRLTALLEQWPDHPVLDQLLSIVRRLQMFSVTSPVAKLMAGLELLLQKSDDWESFASKDHSVKPLLQQVSALIVHWRQLELNSWPSLFQVEDRLQAQNAQQWWLHLYNLAIKPWTTTVVMTLPKSNDQRDGATMGEADGVAQDSNDPDQPLAVSSDLLTTLKTLVHFITSSPLGEFRTRLNLIHAFAHHLEARFVTPREAITMTKVTEPTASGSDPLPVTPLALQRVLAHLGRYYEAYWPLVHDELTRRREPLEKEMKEYVKVATFKDVNVYALKQSAQKTHRALHKCLKKYREVLGTTATHLLTTFDETVRLDTSEDVLKSLKHAQMDSLCTKAKQSRRQRKPPIAADVFNPQTLYHTLVADVQPSFALTLPAILTTYEIPSPLHTLHQAVADQMGTAHVRFHSLNNTLTALHAMVTKGRLYHNGLLTTERLAELAHVVVSRAADLRQSTPPTVTPEPGWTKQQITEAQAKEHTQFYKQMRMVKQKSLVDLLKLLKHLGLHQRPKVATQRALQMDAVLTTLPVDLTQQLFAPITALSTAATDATTKLPVHTLIPQALALWERADRYYQRSLPRLTLLQQAVVQRSSPDLTLAQAQRCLASAESLTYTTHLERQTLGQWALSLTGMLRLMGQWMCLALPATDNTASFECRDAAPTALSSTWHVAFAGLCQTSAVVAQGLVHMDGILRQGEIPFMHQTESIALLAELVNAARTHTQRLCTLRDHLAQFNPAESAADTLFYSPSINTSLLQTKEWLTHCHRSLRQLLSRSPELACFVRPLLAYFDKPIDWSHMTFSESAAHQDSRTLPATVLAAATATTQLVDGLLVAFQQVRAETERITPATAMTDDVDDDEKEFGLLEHTVPATLKHYQTLHRQLALDQAHDMLVTALRANHAALIDRTTTLDQQAYLAHLAHRATPLLTQFLQLTQHGLIDYLYHHGALCKLSHILTSTFVVLVKDGFCTPNFDMGTEMDDDGPGDGSGKLEDGTGIGEGQGEKNVSDEIEHEDQVLGTQNEQEEPPQDDSLRDKDSNDIEMENDFEGQMGDADYTDGDEDDDKDQSDEEPDLDEQLGNVDLNDPTAVDDKMWDGEDEENRPDDPGANIGQGAPQPDSEDKEMVARDDQPEAPKPDNQNQPESKDPNEAKDPDDNEPESEGADEMSAPMNPQDLTVMDPEQGDTMDIPEELDDMGSPEESEGEPDGDDMDQGDLEDPLDAMNDESALPPKNSEQDPADGDATHPDEDQPAEGEEAADENQDDPTQDSATNALPEDVTADQLNQSDGDEPDIEPDTADDTDVTRPNLEEGDEKQPDDPADNADSVNAPGIQAMEQDQERQPLGQDDQDHALDPDHTQDPQQQESMDDMLDRADAHTGESRSMQAQPQPDPLTSDQPDIGQPDQEQKDHGAEPTQGDQDVNPYRSLASAQESWTRRLNVIEQTPVDQDPPPSPEPKPDQEPPVDTSQQFEFTHEDQAHHHATLADAQQPDHAQNPEAIPTMDDGDERLEEPDTDLGRMLPDEDPASLPEADPISYLDQLLKADVTPPLTDADGPEGATLHPNQGTSRETAETAPDVDCKTSDRALVAGQDDSLANALDTDESEPNREELRRALAEQTHDWKATHRCDLATAMALWSKYELLTHDLALSLSEQLRLILEPTLATKLKGDYRTGKRLNMKRIIPYIASQYKKDKIWLRRTKPSKRQYQILIAVDDSKSMAESQSVELAFETLALVAKALSQLETGDIAVASFGHAMHVLHAFDQPFTTDSGASLLRDFTFEQTKTDVVAMMQTSLHLFAQARAQAQGAGDLWQLQLVISDGVCENHERLRALVRQGIEQRVMVVFIVVDNKPEEQSILQLSSVKYQQVDGKLSLRMERYLDTFPFSYYLVLRDIKALPFVLADALRQYFSLVADS
ncbi:AAA ATPase midasin [Dimargaris verticillata]|uniref:Midasin n=1 Tax=Dimargaris verticillata TaxID=2761393 RepID=A0A9W8B941_9FUNG|nr:AAA ATPase midasin [Dimargaris verticillata]